MLRPTTTTEVPSPSAPKDIATVALKASSSTTTTAQSRTRRTPSFLFDSPPSAPLAPTTSNATATSTSKPTKSKSRDSILGLPTAHSPRRSLLASPTRSSSSSSGNSGGFAGGIFSFSSLLSRMPGATSIIPILTNHHHHHSENSAAKPPATAKSTAAAVIANGNANRTMTGTSSKTKPSEPPRLTAAEKQQAIRSAQATLATVGKNWNWSDELRKSKRRRTDTAPNSQPPAKSDDSDDDDDEDEGDADANDREYRSRDESDTDDARNQAKGVKSVYPDDEPRSAYRFHGPDTIGAAKPTREERKERRLKDLKDEMEWNEGLRIWIERRDVWTQADPNGRVPIGKSRFRTNAFYNAVVPEAYPQLYQRIIIKGNTPSIPINLQHMTNALVEGWKADGQWPPKPTRPEPPITRKKAVGISESMVKRVFGIGR
ncbi:hypothetical protein DRE_03218 [Drechslerella stenobrocha 248]|uniref:Gag1-like clamp domain-containing protein n=1 Tax=Drechslerella stenobrocha 248 TaxID=1043628 RepID=W7I616_9PEZI|nr:hypothetical protein DRE_03218 [Drechslerella stenobrocha 248]